MRISLLLQREPFGIILEQTLARFLQCWTKQPHEVRWCDGRPDVSLIRRRRQQPWLCNIYLNAIFVPEAGGPIFDPVRREFARSLLWWRRPAQRAYVDLSTSRLGARWLAQASVGISPALPRADQLLIIPGNHKIRLLDHAKGVVYGILKSGFPPGFMQREVQARQQAAELGVPVPPLDVVEEDGAWFQERYVSGTPLNRLGDEAVVHRAVADATDALQRLLKSTMQQELLNDYVEQLAAQTRAQLSANHLLSEDQKQAVLHTLDCILPQLKALRSAVGGRVLTSLTHGDYQPANLLVNGDGVWLIDWEYAARRQTGYDALVFGLRSRCPAGLADRLQAFVLGHVDGTLAGVPKGWPGTDWDQPESRGVSAMLFVLEELVLHLEENATAQFTRPGPALAIVLQEAKRYVTMA